MKKGVVIGYGRLLLGIEVGGYWAGLKRGGKGVWLLGKAGLFTNSVSWANPVSIMGPGGVCN